ncbi:Actin-binding protein IPP [Eumeta japonica]|uniref:Actin-binding protein IPP n=1 Tax=Eumeta variegata TaxID=151549 RepID=A0A4C2A103_EUMVA|nr:Actin-binding protein IPP [Eumeta japonica]
MNNINEQREPCSTSAACSAKVAEGIQVYGDESWVFKSEKYSLSSGKVANNFKNFRQDGTLCDVDLISGETVVKAHRVVLAAACVYFETMFKSGFEECANNTVPLPSIPPDVLPLLVDFIYTGQTVICGSTVQHLVNAADMMQLEELSTGCVAYLKRQLHPSNVLDIIRLAETHNLVQLAEEALSYAQKNWRSVVEGKEFLNAPVRLLMKLLSSDNLAIDDEVQCEGVVMKPNEVQYIEFSDEGLMTEPEDEKLNSSITVLHAALTWLDHDPPTRKQHCLEILQQVRLRKVSPQKFENELANVRDPAITEILHIFKAVLTAVNKEARPDSRCYMYVVGGSNYSEELNTLLKFDGKCAGRGTTYALTLTPDDEVSCKVWTPNKAPNILLYAALGNCQAIFGFGSLLGAVEATQEFSTVFVYAYDGIVLGRDPQCLHEAKKESSRLCMCLNHQDLEEDV